MELGAECNRPVAGLQLGLEVFSLFFLKFELIYIPKYFANYQPEFRLQCPNSGNLACKKPKTRELNDSTVTVRMFDMRKCSRALSLKISLIG